MSDSDAMAKAQAIAKASRRVDASPDVEIAQAGLEEYSEDGKRYRLERLVGRGAYGAVYIAVDTFDGQRVALKHVVKAFNSDVDARRTYREMLVQAHFEHPNILALRQVLTPRNRHDFKGIYLVMEVMETDLHRVIHSRQDLTSDHISYFVYQLLCGLQNLHAAGVLHRDLKPSNLLVNSDCTLKLCDFGLARESDVSMSTALTEYVVTRWYRAPEVLLSGGKYAASIDTWSVGCILAELLLRRPLFPGENYLNQLQLIVETLGSPSSDDLRFVTNPNALAFMKKIPYSAGTPIVELFPHVRGPCLDLLQKMLIFSPTDRISVEEAITHPFLARVRAARHTVSELPTPRRFSMHSQLNKLKSAEVRALFISRLCGDYTPDHESAPGELFPAVAVAAVERRKAASSSSSSSTAIGTRPPMSSPVPQRRPPAMQDGMFVKKAEQAAATEPSHDEDVDVDDEDDEFADAQDMDGEAPEWLKEEESGSARRATGSSSSGVGNFVNATDVAEDEDEDEGEGTYAYGGGGGGGGGDDLDAGDAYWGSSRDGGAGALAAELLAEQTALADGQGRVAAAAAAAASASSSSSSSSSSSDPLHAVVGRSSGSTLVRLPAHTRSALGAGDSTAISSGDYESSAGRAHPGSGSAIAGRRAGRGRSHLSIAAESKPASSTQAADFISPAGGVGGDGMEGASAYKRSVSPIATPDDDDDNDVGTDGRGSASTGRRFHGSAGTGPKSHGIHRQKPVTSSGGVRGGAGAPSRSMAHRTVQRGIAPLPQSDEASNLDERLFATATATASRTGSRVAHRDAVGTTVSSAAASSSSSSSTIPTRALPQPSSSSSAALGVTSGGRPLSRGGVASLSSVTPPRQDKQQRASGAPGSAHSLSVTPGSRRSASGSIGPASSSGVGRTAGSGFTPDRGSVDASQRSGGRGRRARSSLEYAGAQAAVTSSRPSAWQ